MLPLKGLKDLCSYFRGHTPRPRHKEGLMKAKILAVAATLLLGTSDQALAQMRCTVSDPTGTPLNVRSRPNGRIVAGLHNGSRVLLWQLVYVGGQPWAKITPIGLGKAGWVFRKYLSCQPLYD